jgi:hypothetical protein
MSPDRLHRFDVHRVRESARVGQMDQDTGRVNPFVSMNHTERKRALERIILEMVYDPKDFAEIVEGERPDFTLKRQDSGPVFGVEVTQLFEDESMARLNLLDGYMYYIPRSSGSGSPRRR